jgi:cytochrome c553
VSPGSGAAWRAALAVLAVLALPAAACAYDAAAGQKKAEAVCAACHGPGGRSTVATVPALAEQQPRYIILALYQFRAGNRKSAQMSPFAAALSDDDLGNLAAYYAAQKAAPPANAGDSKTAAAAGRLIEADHCNQCHGPGLAGDEHIPRLAGQHREYLQKQLLGFKAAARGDIDGNMTSAAQALSAADIDRLADYISGLRAP